MTAFDTILNNSAKAVGLNPYIIEDIPDRNAKANINFKFPAIWRNFNEPFQPLFDNNQLYEREMSLYFVHVGFDKFSKELINEHIQEMMYKYEIFKYLMQRAGIMLTFTSKPFPNWKQTNYNEFGIVFNLTATYSKCLTI